ncbi:hypothetical protein RI129_012599 [Pyrocoelia pectoralis]|uniref:Glucose-methanol-choline oxidoreductase N-terminal domain-containing protein n=1 Tax=Pyrocoelia pectoralis TaxID=417401 RepID=A0AAN7V0Q3_9COLE
MLTEIPTTFSSLQLSDEDWKYKTERSEGCCLGLKDGVCLYPRGKVLGGSSALNAMIYIRSYEDDHEHWVKEGNVGWDYESVLKYYERFERGGLNISKIREDAQIREMIIKSYQEMGFQERSDTRHLGYTDTPFTISEGTRQSSAKAFITTIKERPNLYVVLNAQVARLTFNAQGVNGVEVLINQKLIKLKASKEVILSAGAINSPQVLMNSGIGPKEHLQSLGISIKKDLRVGEHFQDHPVFHVLLDVDEEFLRPRSKEQTIDDIYQYVMYRKGYFANNPMVNFLMHLNTNENGEFPNLQVNHIPFPRNSREHMKIFYTGFNYPPDVQKAIFESNEKNSNMIIMLKNLKSKSLGRITLRSADPFDYPQIYPNYLSDDQEEDINTLLYGVRFIQRLMKTKPFADANPQLANLNLPNCEMFQFDTDDYWKCTFKNYVTHLHHPSGTCKMGPESDPRTVVGPDLKVHGVAGVRVIDASIMPRIVSANINAATYMIAEKGAELIKEEWSVRHTEL